MKRMWRCMWGVGALLTLVGYLLDDVQISDGTQWQSWEEFSADPASVAKFQDKVAADPNLTSTAASDPRRAYENYLATVKSKDLFPSISSNLSAAQQLKQRWHAVYRSLTPKRRGHRRALSAQSETLREQIGMGATLALILLVIAILSWGNRWLENPLRP